MKLDDMFFVAVGVAGSILVVGNFFLGLIKGKVMYPMSMAEIAIVRKERSIFLTKAEAPIRFWHAMIVYGITTSLLVFLCVVYYRHPEVFHWE